MISQAFAQAVNSSASGDFSLISLFLGAHIVVKMVILGLLAASVWCWGIIFEKFLMYAKSRKAMDSFEKFFWSGQSLEDLYAKLSDNKNLQSMPALFVAAMREWNRSYETGARSLVGLQSRIDKVLDVSLTREAGRLEQNLLVLASVGATAPFVGLFGTVWGIMSSFAAIAVSESTSLAVVAPGIAEALFATALGLLAAIPAVIAYNKFANEVGKQIARLEGFADEFSAILSRQADHN